VTVAPVAKENATVGLRGQLAAGGTGITTFRAVIAFDGPRR
jgi:hypothetical protein